MSLSNRIKGIITAAFNSLDDLVKPFTLTKVVSQEYDEKTGKTKDVTESFECRGFFDKQDERQNRSSDVLPSDFRIFLESKTEPKVGDVLSNDDGSFTVIDPWPIRSHSVVFIYDVIIRGNHG